MTRAAQWLFGILLAGGLAQSTAAATLDEVKARDSLRCGVNGEVPGLSYQDEAGRWSGLDVDFCRAVAAAALGDKDKVELVALSNAERLDALREGRVDLLARNTTWTLSRDLEHGMTFVGILYFDGQGFMVPRESGLMSTLELGDKRICALADTTSTENARRYFTRHRMAPELLVFPDMNAARAAYLADKCNVLTSDHSQLHALRATLPEPRAHRILPEVISKEPLAPAVRKGDGAWLDLVRWTLHLLINAEELGIDSANVERAAASAKAEDTRLLLDLEGRTGAALGIEPGWGQRVIAQVGNYAEIFERNLGDQSPLGIKRGLNALWQNGGMLYAPPAR